MNELPYDRAHELYEAHYRARPHITKRDPSMLEFYRQVVAHEKAGVRYDHELTRQALGGSFE